MNRVVVCVCVCEADVDVVEQIYSTDLQHGIGRLSVHGWVGVMHEIRRTANDYGLTCEPLSTL